MTSLTKHKVGGLRTAQTCWISEGNDARIVGQRCVERPDLHVSSFAEQVLTCLTTQSMEPDNNPLNWILVRLAVVPYHTNMSQVAADVSRWLAH